MFEGLSQKIEVIFKNLRNRGLLKEEDVDLVLKEVRLALLEADVNFKVVKDFINEVRLKSIGKEVLESLAPAQQVIKIVNEQLCVLLGATNTKIQLSANPPTIIMVVGLQGSGKTTTAAKLALIFKRQGRRPMLVALDLERPAAIEQLITLGKQIDIPVFYSKEATTPIAISEDAIKKSKLDNRDIVILDTAGRLHINEELMNQLLEIKTKINPKEILLVADAMTGQDAVNIAKNFNEKLNFDGVILTKMEGDARGGAAISIRHITGKPIKFIGTGEKMDNIEPFHPDRIANRILGMGDVLTLIEQAQKSFDGKESETLHKKIMEDSFTFDDLKNQIKKIRGMGTIENILSMIPGIGKAIKDVKVDDKEFIKVESIINSMTKQEKKNHEILNGSRRKRIALGSGTTVTDVNRLVKQFLEMKKMMNMFKQSGKKGFKMPTKMFQP